MPDRIVLELDGHAPIAGRVCVAHQPPRHFAGWTALFNALRDAAASDVPLPTAATEET